MKREKRIYVKTFFENGKKCTLYVTAIKTAEKKYKIIDVKKTFNN